MDLVLTITMSPDGRCQVTGPIANKGVCYGMLELARDAIYEYKPDELTIAQPGFDATHFFKRGGNGP
jgi:hypothetical protein